MNNGILYTQIYDQRNDKYKIDVSIRSIRTYITKFSYETDLTSYDDIRINHDLTRISHDLILMSHDNIKSQ